MPPIGAASAQNCASSPPRGGTARWLNSFNLQRALKQARKLSLSAAPVASNYLRLLHDRVGSGLRCCEPVRFVKAERTDELSRRFAFPQYRSAPAHGLHWS